MTLQQLKYVDAVADCGSISEAARQVFVSQPTLTEAIRMLEEELRMAIFTRSSRGMSNIWLHLAILSVISRSSRLGTASPLG